MPFYPKLGDTLTIENTTYRFAEHPAVQGMAMPYGQTGRRGTVYQLADPDGKLYALKVFTHSFRIPRNAEGAEKLRPFASLPGLQVCARIALPPQSADLPQTRAAELDYAVLMPWMAGTTWQEIMLEQRVITNEQSYALARTLAHILATMETQHLAHGDLSAPNLLVTLDPPSVTLVDVEDLYSPGLSRPEKLPGGSPGYAHRTAAQGLWGPNTDRFAGAVLLAEMLSWCDERIRHVSCREKYFDPKEMQEDGERFQVLLGVLRERYSIEIAEAFERAWYSDTVEDCPTLTGWEQLLKAPFDAPKKLPDEPSYSDENQHQDEHQSIPIIPL